MSRRQAKELPNIMKLGTNKPKIRADEIPHWKVWEFIKRNPGVPWKRDGK